MKGKWEIDQVVEWEERGWEDVRMVFPHRKENVQKSGNEKKTSTKFGRMIRECNLKNKQGTEYIRSSSYLKSLDLTQKVGKPFHLGLSTTLHIRKWSIASLFTLKGTQVIIYYNRNQNSGNLGLWGGLGDIMSIQKAARGNFLEWL